MSKLTIDIPESAGPVYTGRPRGEELRRRLALDEKEDQAELVEVTIPEGTYTISSSYFLGLLGPSIRKCGSLSSFEQKFKFQGPDFLKDLVHDHAALAMQRRAFL